MRCNETFLFLWVVSCVFFPQVLNAGENRVFPDGGISLYWGHYSYWGKTSTRAYFYSRQGYDLDYDRDVNFNLAHKLPRIGPIPIEVEPYVMWDSNRKIGFGLNNRYKNLTFSAHHTRNDFAPQTNFGLSYTLRKFYLWVNSAFNDDWNLDRGTVGGSYRINRNINITSTGYVIRHDSPFLQRDDDFYYFPHRSTPISDDKNDPWEIRVDTRVNLSFETGSKITHRKRAKRPKKIQWQNQ